MSDIVASQTAARTEAARIADHQTELAALRSLGRPLAAPDPVLVIDMRLAQLDMVYVRPWQEFQRMAARAYIDSLAALEDARVVSVRLDEAKLGHPDNG